MKEKKLYIVTFRTNEKTLKKLKARSDNELRSISQIINIILKRSLEEGDKNDN